MPGMGERPRHAGERESLARGLVRGDTPLLLMVAIGVLLWPGLGAMAALMYFAQRMLGDPPHHQPEPGQWVELRFLAICVALALVWASDKWWGLLVALPFCWLLGSPYMDFRARRFLRR